MINSSLIKRNCIVLILFLIGGRATCEAQLNTKVYSVFIYSFAKSIKWPEPKGDGIFLIGVLDCPLLSLELQKVALDKSVGIQKILIKEFDSVDKIEDCHILFLPSERSQLLSSIISKLPSNAMLIISDGDGLAKKGSGLSFVKIDGKLRFEINSHAIEARGIKVPGNIKSLGMVVE